MLTGLSVCTGYGGIDLALQEYVKPIAYVEIEEYAQKIIAYRMADGSLKRATLLADIKNVEGKLGVCDILYGGTPCQNFSVAGDGKGLEGERSSLFFEFARLAREIRPSFIFWENVPGARTKGFTEVVRTFTEMGYDCRWTIVSAQAVGANHRRERLFLLAYTNDSGHRLNVQQISELKLGNEADSRSDGEIQYLAYASSEGLQVRRQSGFSESIKERETRMEQELERCCEVMADPENKHERLSIGETQEHAELGNSSIISNTDSKRLERQWKESSRVKSKLNYASDSSWWSTEPNVGRVANGTPFRVDRIKALGNGVVPLQAKVAFEYLMGIK